MKKLTGLILAGALVLSMGSQAFAADTNNGNHYGWEKGKHNPHKLTLWTTDTATKEYQQWLSTWLTSDQYVQDLAIVMMSFGVNKVQTRFDGGVVPTGFVEKAIPHIENTYNVKVTGVTHRSGISHGIYFTIVDISFEIK